MKVQFTWEEIEKYILIGLRYDHPALFTPGSDPAIRFIKDYGCDGVGEMYDFPTTVEIDFLPSNPPTP